jgi:hypothetical protein
MVTSRESGDRSSNQGSSPGALGLACPGWTDGSAIARASLLVAADRPDRLEVHWVPRGLTEAGVAAPFDRDRSPAVEFQLDGERLFSGLLRGRALEIESTGMLAGLVAWSAYDARRDRLSNRRWYESTDAEIAVEIASELGLRADVESTEDIHRIAECRGDPLRYLRARARAIGFDLAIANGTLHFRSEIDSPAGAVARLGVGVDALSSVRLVDRGAGGRGGRCLVAGDPRWRPLRRFDLAGLGAWDGRYRAIRCRHVWDAAGYTTAIDFLETGIDWTAWREELG